MLGKITKKTVDTLPAGTQLWDTALPGFCARRRAGDTVVYAVKYRAAGRRQRWLKLGAHGPMMPDTARKEAQQVLAAVARGDDPAGARQQARTAATMSALFDRFITEHVEPKLRATTIKEYTRLIAATLRPALGAIPITAVTADDVARLHQRMKTTPVLANRVIVVLTKALALAERWGMRPPGTNPGRGIEKFRERKKTRRLSLEELGRFGGAIAAAEAGPLEMLMAKGRTTKVHVSPFALAAIKLLVFTGARKSEILTARWEWVDRARAVLHLPDSKSDAKDILLPAPALAVLDGLPRIEGSPYLVPGARHGHPLVNISKPLAAILSAAKLEGVTLHVLRHSYASIGVDAGLSLPIVGRLLGHASPSTTQRYAHIQDPVRAASELIGRRLTEAMEAGQ